MSIEMWRPLLLGGNMKDTVSVQVPLFSHPTPMEITSSTSSPTHHTPSVPPLSPLPLPLLFLIYRLGIFFFYFSLIINQNTHLESSFLLWVNEAAFMEVGWRVGAWFFFLRNCMNFTDSSLCSEVHITIFMYELRRKNCNFAMCRFQWKLLATFFRFQGKLSVTFSQ